MTELLLQYHKQSFQYVQGISKDNLSHIDPIGQSNVDIGLKLDNNSSFLKNVAGGVGFAPHTQWRNLPQLLFFPS